MAKPITQWTTKDIQEYFAKLDKKSKIKIGAFSLGGLLLFLFVIWPAWITRFQVGGEHQNLKSRIGTAQITIAQAPKLLQEQKEHEAFIQSVKPRLLREDEREGIVGIIAGIAKKTEVTLISAEPNDQDDEEGEKIPEPFDTRYRKTTYWVTVEGGYHPLAKFVSEIEGHAKILRVDDFSISPKEETPRVHLGQIHVSAFSMIQEKG